VEIAGDDAGDVAERVMKARAATSAVDVRLVESAAEQAVLWRIREEGAGLATRTLPGIFRLMSLMIPLLDASACPLA
jgi:hypothetical protein